MTVHGAGKTAFIGIGSNMGDRVANCLEAIREAANDNHAAILGVSSLYVTSPVSNVVQDDFVNCAVAIIWSDSPFALLRHLNEIEDKMGRVRDGIKDGPRVIDLDILLFADLVLSDPVLTIPHPQLHRRKFAIIPCLEIDPGLIHPALQKPLAVCLTENDEEQKIRLLRKVDLRAMRTGDLRPAHQKDGIGNQ